MIDNHNFLDELKSLGTRIKNMEQQLIKKDQKIVRKLKMHHKILFAAIVFTGVVFLWYGAWSLISELPWLNNPFIALGIGVVLLLGTGMYYRNTL